MKNKGVTLVELLIVIVITGIIATFVVISAGNIVENSQINVDSYNIDELNSITEKYADVKGISTGDIFDGISTNESRIQKLVDEGSLSYVIEPQQSGATYNWNVASQNWELIGGTYNAPAGLSSSSLTFANESIPDLEDTGAVSMNMSKWTSGENGGLVNTTGQTNIFIPISKQTYTITVTANLSTGNAGGYGIFFDTTLRSDNPSKDDGLIFQFDRGYGSGAMIVRPRSNGRESGAVWTVREYQTDAFPNKSTDPDWWTDTHTVRIVVENVDASTRKATFYIDGIELGSYEYDNEIEGKQIYTGFRGWGGSYSEFHTLSVN